MRGKTRLSYISLLMFILFFGVNLPTLASKPLTVATLCISPSLTTVDTGEFFTVNVTIADVTDLAAWDLKLYYLNDILNGTLPMEGPFLKQGGTTQFFAVEFNDQFNATHGLIRLTCTLMGMVPGVNGSGTLASIIFKAVGEGTTPLHLSETKLVDSQLPNPQPIDHTTIDGEVHAAPPNLIIDTILVENNGCTVYADDTYANGTAYHTPVKITVNNTGNLAADPFNLGLTVYWIDGSLQEDYIEWRISSLPAAEKTTLTYSWRPSHTGYYNLTAVVDCDGEVQESNENDNSLVVSDFPVALMGDVNCDGSVGIVDAVIVSLAWASSPGDSNWKLCADLNHDGVVNIGDGVRIMLHWVHTW